MTEPALVKRPVLHNVQPGIQLLIFTGLLLVFLGLSNLAALLMIEPLFGMKPAVLMKVRDYLHDPRTVNVLRFAQTLSAIGTFIIPAWIMARLNGEPVRTYFRMNTSARAPSYLWTFLLVLAALPLINWLAQMNSRLEFPAALKEIGEVMQQMEEQAAELTKIFLNITTIPGLLFTLFMVAFLPALGEEMVFRGVIQRLMTPMVKNIHLSIWITAAIFSFFHMQILGFLPRMMLGAFMGYLFAWSGSLWLPILFHFLNNGLAVLFAYLEKTGVIGFNTDTIGSPADAWMYGLLSLPVCLGIMWMIRRTESGERRVESESGG